MGNGDWRMEGIVGEPTFPGGVRRVDLLEDVDGASAVGCGEDGFWVDVVFFAYADMAKSAPMIWERSN